MYQLVNNHFEMASSLLVFLPCLLPAPPLPPIPVPSKNDRQPPDLQALSAMQLQHEVVVRIEAGRKPPTAWRAAAAAGFEVPHNLRICRRMLSREVGEVLEAAAVARSPNNDQ